MVKAFDERLEQQVKIYLADFHHPTLRLSLTDLGALQYCAWQKLRAQIHLRLPFIWQEGFQELQRLSQEHAWFEPLGAEAIDWRLQQKVSTIKPTNGQPLIPGIRNLLAIYSAKGGVGKSSIAVNFALALATEGAKVGLLDADIYGPSIPILLGATGQRPLIQQQQMQPIEAHGIVMNSIGYLLADDAAVLWRGPMASRAVEQLLRETVWPELDYLIIDMPPGTGDIPLTLAQRLPITAAIAVTTPQPVAIRDTQRSIHLWKTLGIPVLGIIENMSSYHCPQCESSSFIFGTGGGQQLADHFSLPLLGQFPLQSLFRKQLDQGVPSVIAEPQSAIAKWFYRLANKVSALLYWQGQTIADAIKIKTCD